MVSVIMLEAALLVIRSVASVRDSQSPRISKLYNVLCPHGISEIYLCIHLFAPRSRCLSYGHDARVEVTETDLMSCYPGRVRRERGEDREARDALHCHSQRAMRDVRRTERDAQSRSDSHRRSEPREMVRRRKRNALGRARVSRRTCWSKS